METGITYTFDEIAVRPSDTAKFRGSGTLDVLATPSMIGYMEYTAWNCVAPYLSEGETTVGTEINVKHLSATPVGCTVTYRAELIEIDGRKLTFRVTASDVSGIIGEGTHTRYIIKTEKFLAKAREKLK